MFFKKENPATKEGKEAVPVMNDHEQLALTKLRDAYVSGKPALEAIIKEHQRAQAVLNLFTSSILLSPDVPPDIAEAFIANVEIVQSYITMTYGVITMMHSAAQMVSHIMSEHEVNNEH